MKKTSRWTQTSYMSINAAGFQTVTTFNRPWFSKRKIFLQGMIQGNRRPKKILLAKITRKGLEVFPPRKSSFIFQNKDKTFDHQDPILDRYFIPDVGYFRIESNGRLYVIKNHESKREVVKKTKHGKSLVSFLIGGREEKKSLLIALGLGLSLLMASTFFLTQPSRRVSTSLDDLNSAYLLGVVHHDFFSVGPEALKSNLDRSRFIEGTYAFVDSIYQLVNYGSSNTTNKHLLYPNSIKRYDNRLSERDRQKEYILLESEQRFIKTKQAHRLSVPIVVGDGAYSRSTFMLNLFDNMIEQMKEAVEMRGKIAREFVKDPPYSFTAYKDAPGTNTQVQEALSQISAFSIATDEQMMNKLAADIALKAREVHFDKQSAEKKAKVYGIAPDLLAFIKARNQIADTFDDALLNGISGSALGEKSSQGWQVIEPKVGRLAPHLIQRVINNHRHEIRKCYEESLRSNRNLEGTSQWQWTIDSLGRVTDLKQMNSSIKSRSMTACLRGKITAWRFPKPENGSVVVNYPFKFSRTTNL